MSTVESMEDMDILKRINVALSSSSIEELEEMKLRALSEGREPVALFLQDAIQMFIDRKVSVSKRLATKPVPITKVERVVMYQVEIMNKEVDLKLDQYRTPQQGSFMMFDKFDINQFLLDYAKKKYEDYRHVIKIVRSLEKRMCEEVRWHYGIRFKDLQAIQDTHNHLLTEMQSEKYREEMEADNYVENQRLKFAYNPTNISAAI
jgi:hypothetical protein